MLILVMPSAFCIMFTELCSYPGAIIFVWLVLSCVTVVLRAELFTLCMVYACFMRPPFATFAVMTMSPVAFD